MKREDGRFWVRGQEVRLTDKGRQRCPQRPGFPGPPGPALLSRVSSEEGLAQPPSRVSWGTKPVWCEAGLCPLGPGGAGHAQESIGRFHASCEALRWIVTADPEIKVCVCYLNGYILIF